MARSVANINPDGRDIAKSYRPENDLKDIEEGDKEINQMARMTISKTKRTSQTAKNIKTENTLRAKYTIDRTGVFFQVWNIINILACLFTTIMYPYYTVNELPEFEVYNTQLWLLIGFESICLVNIVINFFLQELDEDGGSK